MLEVSDADRERQKSQKHKPLYSSQLTLLWDYTDVLQFVKPATG